MQIHFLAERPLRAASSRQRAVVESKRPHAVYRIHAEKMACGKMVFPRQFPRQDTVLAGSSNATYVKPRHPARAGIPPPVRRLRERFRALENKQ
jgi:hypothetical protein